MGRCVCVRGGVLWHNLIVLQLKSVLITGLHTKEGFTMSMDYYYDSWNDADQQAIDPKELTDLDNEVFDLREEIQNYQTDEVFVLYHLMNLRDKHKGNADLIADLDELIKVHSSKVQEQAKLYTRRGEAWDYD